MTKAIKYTEAPAEIERALESATSVNDFLPSPPELIRKVEKEKSLSRELSS